MAYVPRMVTGNAVLIALLAALSPSLVRLLWLPFCTVIALALPPKHVADVIEVAGKFRPKTFGWPRRIDRK
jgi:hypothetical protein